MGSSIDEVAGIGKQRVGGDFRFGIGQSMAMVGAVSYRLTDPLSQLGPEDEDPIRRWIKQLSSGAPAERQRAVRQLIRKRAEPALVECLRSPDALAVSLATNALWECWLNERGRHARSEIDRGVGLMESGEYREAEEVFLNLMAEYPDWAEAKNKQATLLYLRGQPALSMALCAEVVRLKPHHFGAWNGMALCAAQLGKWTMVLHAATKALEIQPNSEANLHLIQLAKEQLDEG
jgi:tetratricopeptide (TPR) repeat protein